MASVSIKYSQNVIDELQALSSENTSLNGSFDSLAGLFTTAAYLAAPAVPVDAWRQFGSTVVLAYPDSSTESYMDVVFDNPGADTGHASASGYEFHQDGALTISATGHFNVDYTITPATPVYASTLSLAPSAAGSTLDYLRFATELASTDAGYDPLLGNVALVFDGALTLGADGDASGTISRITTSSDKILAASTIDGQFLVDASLPGGIGGTITGYQEQYYDGSQAQVGGVAIAVDPAQLVDLDMLSDPASFGGSDDIAVDMPARLYEATTIAAGAGDDRISLKGGGGLLGVAAGGGDDRITLLDAGHAVDGGAGLDTVVLAAPRAGFTLAHGAADHNVVTVTDGAGAVDQLTGVERIEFADGAYALDVDGNAGAAYRLFQAAYTPYVHA